MDRDPWAKVAQLMRTHNRPIVHIDGDGYTFALSYRGWQVLHGLGCSPIGGTRKYI